MNEWEKFYQRHGSAGAARPASAGGDDSGGWEGFYSRYASRPAEPTPEPVATIPPPDSRVSAGSIAKHLNRGIGEGFTATARGIGKLPGLSAVGEWGEQERDRLREDSGEADHWAEMGAGVAGRILSEGAQFVGAGMGAGAVARGALKVLPKAGRAAEIAGAIAKPNSFKQRLLRDAVAGGPVDAAIAAAGPEESMIGGIAELTENEALGRMAENPLTRIPTDVALGMGAGALVEGVGAGVRGLRKATDYSDDVAAGFKDFDPSGLERSAAEPNITDHMVPPPRSPWSAEPPRLDRVEPMSQKAAAIRRAKEFQAEEEAAALRPPPADPLASVQPPERPLIEVVPGRTGLTSREIASQKMEEEARMLANVEGRRLPPGIELSEEAPRPPITVPPPRTPIEPSRGPQIIDAAERGRLNAEALDIPPPARPTAAVTPKQLDARERVTRPGRQAEDARMLELEQRKAALEGRTLPEGKLEVPGAPREGPAPEIEIAPGLRSREAGAVDEAGIAASEVMQVLGGATVGGAVDLAAGDDKSPLEGMLVGAGLAAGTGAVLRRPAAKGAPKYLDSEAVREVLGTIADDESTTFLGRLTAALGETPEKLRQTYTRVVNQSDPLEKWGRAVGKTDKLKHEISRGRGWQSAAQNRLDNQFRTVLKQAEGHEKGTTALAKSERIIELHEAGIKEVDPETLATHRQAIEELGQVPELRKAVDALRAYYRDLLDYKLENGVLTQEAYDAIVANGQAYAPLLPESVAENTVASAGGGRLTNRTPGVRRMSKGILDDERTIDPFEQAIIDTQEVHKTVSKQRVTNVVAQIVEENPETAAAHGIRKWTPHNKDYSPEKLESLRTQIAKAEAEGNAKKADLLRENLAKREQELAILEKAVPGNTVKAVVNGKQAFFEVTDQELFDAWAAFDPYTGNIFTTFLSPFKKALQTTVTLLPDFALANTIRDNAQAGIQYAHPVKETLVGAGLGATAGAMKNEEDRLGGALIGGGLGMGMGGMAPNIARTLSAMRNIVGNDKIYREWLHEGGGGFGFYVRTPKDARKVLKDLQHAGVSKSDIINPKSWVHALQMIGRATENAPRLARYKAMRKAGMEVPEAIHSARDVSLDFARIGKDTKGYASVTAFFNAKVQGWDKTARLLKSPKTWATGASMITAPSIALWNINKDNPEYWDTPQWERNLFWLVPKDDGGFYRIPKPFEIGFVFASLPERLLDFAHEKDPETVKFALRDMLRTTTDGALPLPTGLQPLAENVLNRDFFTRRPVVGMGLERLPDEMQHDNRTSSVAVKLGEITKYSPQKIDNLIGDWFGGVGRELSIITNDLARSTGIDDRPASPAGKPPLVGRFLTRADQLPESELQIRRKFTDAEKVYNGAREMIERGDEAKAKTYVQKNREQILRYQELRPVKGMLDEVSRMRRAIGDHPDWTPEQKREALINLNSRMATMLRRPRTAPGE